jgi:hypothetical protein
MEHHFNIELATKLGIEEAIFLNNLYYWLQKNASNGKNYFDGSYWTYNTKQAYTEIFPYMSYDKIKRMINLLKEKSIIKTGHYDENKMNRTLWYAFTECGLKMMKNAGYKVTVLGFKDSEEEDDKNCIDEKEQKEPSQKSILPQCTTNINKTDIKNKETLETSSRVKERLSHKYNKDKPLTDIEVKFYLGMEQKYPRVMHMDVPLKYSQYQQLLKDGISNKKIIANLEAMENWKILKDRVKAYNTLLTFLKKDRNEYPQEMA